LNLNSRLAGHKLGKPNLYETAIKANKNRFAELVCVRSYFITKWRGFSRDKTKKHSDLSEWQFQPSPQKSSWVLLRKTLISQTKTGALRLNLSKSSFLVRMYDEARTYFQENP
jgi:hypothetical protein